MRLSLRDIVFLGIGGLIFSALCYFADFNIFGGVHGIGSDITYTYDTTLIELPVTESKDIQGQKPDTILIKEIVDRWHKAGYDTTFIVLRDTLIKRIEEDPFALVVAFSDSLKWRNNLTVVLPQGQEQIADSGYLYVKGHADFLTGKIHLDPIRSSPFKAVTIDKTETITRDKKDWLSVSLYAERGLIGDTGWAFGARARVYLGDMMAYISGDMDGNLTPSSKVGLEMKLLYR